MALNSLEAAQTNPTDEIAKQITQFLNYSTTYTELITENRKSGMIIHIYSDASYISELEARSRTRRYFFQGPNSKTSIQYMPPDNGPVHVECRIMRNVMASAKEAETGGYLKTIREQLL